MLVTHFLSIYTSSLITANANYSQNKYIATVSIIDNTTLVLIGDEEYTLPKVLQLSDESERMAARRAAYEEE